MENEETIRLIKKTLDKIRPFLQRDGGDVTFDSYENGIVYVNIHGACEGCALINNDIEEGIEVLTGVPAGKKDKDGHFPAGTVNYLVYEKLKKYAKVSYEK